MNIEQGSVVYPRTGGLPMTVENITFLADGYRVVTCRWFDGEGQFHACDFTLMSLTTEKPS